MFRTWKIAVNTPIGMFEQWGLDQMLRRHRTRMSTFYKEGKLPENSGESDPGRMVEGEQTEVESSNDNPYLAGEHGEAQLQMVETTPGVTQSDQNDGHLGRKPYVQFLMKHGGVRMRPEPADGEQNDEGHKVGIYEHWAQVQNNQPPGMYDEWRAGGRRVQKTKDKPANSSPKEDAMSYDAAQKAVMAGDVSASSCLHKRQLRIVVCSTFCDTKAERQRLSREVFPRIREVCAQHGVDFLAVDLGWGQADGTLTEAGFADMFLLEVKRSLRESIPITSLLVFLTDKYGGPGLPLYIGVEEFEIIIDCIEDEDERCLVKRWYCWDENAVPPAYRLQTVAAGPTLIAPDKHERRVMSARWSNTESHLMSLLQQGVKKSKYLTDQQLEKWTHSPFDNLITKTVLQWPEIKTKALCVVRDIAQAQRPFNIPEVNVNGRILQQYVDMDPERPVPDPHSRTRLTDMRKSMKDKKVKCNKYVVNWSPYGITEATHEAYVRRVGGTVWKHLSTRIKAALAGVWFYAPDIMEEVASHSRFCVQQAAEFCGREDLVELVLSNISQTQNGKQEGNTSLVIHGVRGSGKTALMAKCGSLMRKTLSKGQQETDPVVAIRFCGLIKQPTTVNLLRSLCLQIYRAYREIDLDHITSDIPTLSSMFNDLLSEATEHRPLVIMLDSIDAVAGATSGHLGLKWLPSILPAYVQIIMSSSDAEAVLSQHTQGACKTIEVPHLSWSEAEPMLRQMLSKIYRSLTKGQKEYVVSAAVGKLEETPTVLRLKLLFDTCKEWASYDYLTVYRHTVPAMYVNMLEALELEHGKVLVAHVFSLILVAHHGLSEAELLDVLSGDEEVLDSVLLLNQPPVRRFPQSALFRLLQGLDGHLTEVFSYGRIVLVFTNRQMEDAIRKRYLGTTVHMTEKYCSFLADYFGGEMQDRYPGRGLAPQPLFWRNPRTGRVHFNRAKLSELPAASSRAPYPSSAHSSLCDLTFITAKCVAGMYLELLEDYSLAGELFPGDEQLNSYFEFVSNYGLEIAKNPRDVITLALRMAPTNAVHVQAKSSEDTGTNAVPWLLH